ncbi:MAG: hypothetical protein IJI51_00410 [Lachnospiraceae bacterium]|nr:hypothetical protein [Lachnospiraceae bacterium]
MSDMKKDKYGINVRKWCRDHEETVKNALAGTGRDDLQKILALHEKRLSWLMHERLIHVVVLLITVITALSALGIVLMVPDSAPFSLVFFTVTFVLMVFYVRHYFFLENTVQHWYMLYDLIRERIG